jgi:hypothetical protein
VTKHVFVRSFAFDSARRPVEGLPEVSKYKQIEKLLAHAIRQFNMYQKNHIFPSGAMIG